MANKDISWFGYDRKPSKVVKKTGNAIVKVGTIIGAGILVGMGFHAFSGAANNY